MKEATTKESIMQQIEENIIIFFETLNILEERLASRFNQNIFVYAVKNEADLIDLYVVPGFNQMELDLKSLDFVDQASLLRQFADKDIEYLLKINNITSDEFFKITSIAGKKYVIDNALHTTDIIAKPIINLKGSIDQSTELFINYQTDILSILDNEKLRRLRFTNVINRPLANINPDVPHSNNSYQEIYHEIIDEQEVIRYLKPTNKN